MLSIFQTVIASLIGTTLMSLTMAAIQHSGWAKADMIRALGSVVTKSYEGSIKPGILIHFTSGAFFAFPYVAVLSGLGLSSTAAIIGLGGLFGFVHGFVMSFILIAVIAEIHPLPQFQEAGFEVAAAHVLGHIAYGIGVALGAALLGIDFGFRF